LKSVFISATYHSRDPVWNSPPTRNLPWLYASIFVTVLSVLFSFLGILSIETKIERPVYWIYLIALCPLIIHVVIQEMVKTHERNHWNQFQKRRNLEFNTRLGMHSVLTFNFSLSDTFRALNIVDGVITRRQFY
jgi:ACR3 family arsenite efflux pump ArsB